MSSQSMKRKIAVIKSDVGGGDTGVLTRKCAEIAQVPQRRKTAVLVSETVISSSQPASSSPPSNQARQIDKLVSCVLFRL